STGAALGIMLLLGLGLGMVMQVLVIAVQNAVDYRDLGVATSGATLFRLIGGSLGTAMLGAVFAQRLAGHLARMLPAGAAPAGASGMTPEALAKLPSAVRAVYAQAFTQSLGTVFLVATAIALAGFLLTWLLPERPLRATVAAAAADAGQEAGEAFALPADPDLAQHLLRGLSALADRDVQRRYIQAVVSRAGVSLSPAAAWLLIRLDEDPALDPAALGRTRQLPEERMTAALEELAAARLVERSGAASAVTDEGRAVVNRLVDARRAHLAELVSDWEPERHAELAGVLRRIAADLVPEARGGRER
ncbi:MAG: EmrB/QacA family drug resistance transporter, partial [Gemmatimonadetes bacterium]|nr:EmrB/QacA family drug resistance transporter [Gemmatimonadota bacterium]